MFTAIFGLSRRWEMMMWLGFGIAINYSLRVNMSVSAPTMKDKFDWSESQRSYALSSFFFGYALGQIPFSKLAQVEI